MEDGVDALPDYRWPNYYKEHAPAEAGNGSAAPGHTRTDSRVKTAINMISDLALAQWPGAAPGVQFGHLRPDSPPEEWDFRGHARRAFCA